MKIAAQELTRSSGRGKSEPIILFSLGRQLLAIAADAVQEIRSTDSIAGSATEISPSAVPKVRHMFERENRQYFLVNACAHFRLPVTRPTLVLILRQIRVAVLIDRIDRMAEIGAIFALPRFLTGEETIWYRGLAYLSDRVIPVVDPRGFLTAAEFEVLDRTAAAPTIEGTIPA